MNHLVNIKENVNKITNKKINKNIRSDSNTLSQNQQRTDNHDLHCREHDHEKHDCRFDREKNIQNFSTEFKTDNEKKRHKFVIYYYCQKKRHYINKCITSALIKNTNTQ